VSVTIAEEFGIKPGKDIHGIIVTVLRKIGFKLVFDSAFGADLSVMEMTAELINKREKEEKTPLFAGFCPAWIKYTEQFWPQYMPMLSEVKSPQQLLGSVIKNYYANKSGIPAGNIYSVAVSPCIARKFEAQREDMTSKGISDIDNVLTTRELAKLIRLYGIDLDKVDTELSDEPFGMRSTAGKLSAVSGGITESLIRTLHYQLTGKEVPGLKISELRGLKGRKEFKLKSGKEKFSFAVVSGLKNANLLMEEIESGKSQYDFVEVMACPGGCINGGGQPIRPEEGCLKSRMKTLYDLDEKEMIKVAHKNPKIIELYEEYIGEPGGPVSRDKFIARYVKRSVLL
jgi:iron-only hydrogenase group A